MKSERPLNPLLDLFVRFLLGSEENKDLCLNFINAVLSHKSLPTITTIELRNPFNLAEYIKEKETILDIKATDNAGRIINIEIQIVPNPTFANRSLYYWARNYQKQLNKSEKFDDLAPVLCINLVDTSVFPEIEDYHTSFFITERDNPEYVLTDHLEIHFIELEKYLRTINPNDPIHEDLERWCQYFKHEGYLEDEEMKVLLHNNKAMEKAHEVYRKFTADEKNMELIEAREKWQRDYNTGMSYQWKSGYAKGEKKGEKKGEEKKAMETAMLLIQDGMEKEKIARFTGLSMDTIEGLME